LYVHSGFASHIILCLRYFTTLVFELQFKSIKYKFRLLSISQIQSLQRNVAYNADERSYRQLFYYFHPILRRFAFNVLHNTEVAEEITSDVLLKVWTKREKLFSIEDLKLYLFKAIKNASLNYLDSAAYKKSLITFEIDQEGDCLPTSDSEYLQTEMQQIILNAIDQLPPKCQIVFKLVKEYGLSYRQTSEIMEISQNTLETHMRLALKKLRTVLDNYYITIK